MKHRCRTCNQPCLAIEMKDGMCVSCWQELAINLQKHLDDCMLKSGVNKEQKEKE